MKDNPEKSLAEAIQILKDTDKLNQTKANSELSIIIDACWYGVINIIECLNYIGDFELNDDSEEKAVESFAFRYLLTIPFKAKWAIEAFTSGYHSVGNSIARGLLEETLGFYYFHRNPDIALQALRDPDYKERKVNTKFKKLGFKQSHPFRKYYDILSEQYVHPKGTRISGLPQSENQLVPEPYYDKIQTEYNLSFILHLLTSTIGSAGQIFGHLYPDDYRKKTENYLKDALTILDRFTG